MLWGCSLYARTAYLGFAELCARADGIYAISLSFHKEMAKEREPKGAALWKPALLRNALFGA